MLTLRFLTAIANELAGIPGRKNVIWISDGFALVDWSKLAEAVFDQTPKFAGATSNDMGDPQTYHSEMVRAMEAVSGANVSIYPIEARGLVFPGVRERFNYAAAIRAAYINATQTAKDERANRTGRRAFYNTNDIFGAIREAADDSGATYTLGFYPKPALFDGKFHKITVELPGIKAVKLRYRSGYFDSKLPEPSPDIRKSELERTTWSPIEATALPLAVTMARVSRDGTCDVRIVLAPGTLSLLSDGERWVTEWMSAR